MINSTYSYVRDGAAIPARSAPFPLPLAGNEKHFQPLRDATRRVTQNSVIPRRVTGVVAGGGVGAWSGTGRGGGAHGALVSEI